MEFEYTFNNSGRVFVNNPYCITELEDHRKLLTELRAGFILRGICNTFNEIALEFVISE